MDPCKKDEPMDASCPMLAVSRTMVLTCVDYQQLIVFMGLLMVNNGDQMVNNALVIVSRVHVIISAN